MSAGSGTACFPGVKGHINSVVRALPKAIMVFLIICLSERKDFHPKEIQPFPAPGKTRQWWCNTDTQWMKKCTAPVQLGPIFG